MTSGTKLCDWQRRCRTDLALLVTGAFCLSSVVWILVAPGIWFLVSFGLMGAGELWGVYRFKQGFGGQVFPLHPHYCYFSNPVVRTVFNLGGARLLQSGIFRRLEKMIFKRA